MLDVVRMEVWKNRFIKMDNPVGVLKYKLHRSKNFNNMINFLQERGGSTISYVELFTFFYELRRGLIKEKRERGEIGRNTYRNGKIRRQKRTHQEIAVLRLVGLLNDTDSPMLLEINPYFDLPEVLGKPKKPVEKDRRYKQTSARSFLMQ